MQRVFDLALGAQILADSYRWLPHAAFIDAPVKVKAAAVLGLALKWNSREAGSKTIHRLWGRVAGGKMKLVKPVERAIFHRWSMTGLESECVDLE